MSGPQSMLVTDMTGQMVTVLCCMCGIPIAPNQANTCATCLASASDITKGISTEATLHQCRGCQRWHKEAGKWVACELESRELMALCLENVNGLKASKNNGERVRLIDASWIWTEPHSMRLKVRLTIQKEVQQGTILQQAFTVIFVVRNQQCLECQAEFRQGSWKALVQIRQRVAHKRTFLYLEQLILKHGAHRGCLSIETFRDGMDFYFPDKGKAARFMAFLESVVPAKVSSSRQVILRKLILLLLILKHSILCRLNNPRSSLEPMTSPTFPITNTRISSRFVLCVRMIWYSFQPGLHETSETSPDLSWLKISPM
jgi:nonsense-mediated mRNA decay protein 3